MATRIYEQNKAVGWWDDPGRCLFECLQLVSTEVAEATEGERKDLMDDHLPHRKMGEVELADALIRVLDLGGHLGISYSGPRKVMFLASTYGGQPSIGALHLTINLEITDMAIAMDSARDTVPETYGNLIDCIVAVSKHLGYDIQSAMEEKLEYNAHRADHKRENRQKAGGKKF